MRARPKRIQRKRVKGWKMPPNTVYVGRPTQWGNPFTTFGTGDKMTPEEAVRCFRVEVLARIRRGVGYPLRQLRGKNLACWCPLDQPCHADVLLEIANSELGR